MHLVGVVAHHSPYRTPAAISARNQPFLTNVPVQDKQARRAGRVFGITGHLTARLRTRVELVLFGRRYSYRISTSDYKVCSKGRLQLAQGGLAGRIRQVRLKGK